MLCSSKKGPTDSCKKSTPGKLPKGAAEFYFLPDSTILVKSKLFRKSVTFLVYNCVIIKFSYFIVY